MTASLRSSSSLICCLCAGLALCAASASAAAKDACSLLTSDDAQTAIGEPVGPPRDSPRSTGSSEGSECRYRSTQGSALRAKTVALTVHYGGPDTSGTTASMMDNLKATGFTNVHEVAGVGDSAIWAENTMMGRPLGELTVRKGKSIVLVIIITGLPDHAVTLERAKALAAKVVPKA